jgi:hypothetical protein
MTGTSGKRQLSKLLTSPLDSQEDVQKFCSAFERIYNFETKADELSEAEDRIFSELFDVIAWYTPDSSERLELPRHFRDEEDVRSAVKSATEKLEKLIP